MKKIFYCLLPVCLCGCETLRETDPEFFRKTAEQLFELISKL